MGGKLRGAWRSSPLEEEGVLWLILSSLPLRKIFQLRMVCKLWNIILTSPAFLKIWSLKHFNHHHHSCCSPWLVMVRKHPEEPLLDRELVAYDSGAGTWISLRNLLAMSCSQADLARLGGPALPLVANLVPPVDGSMFTDFLAQGSQDGLICFLCSSRREKCKEEDYRNPAQFMEDALVDNGYYLVVLNPVTGSFTMLPPPLKHTVSFESWKLLDFSFQALPHGHYRVLLKYWHYEYPRNAEIYESSTRAWKVGRSCRSLSDAKMAGAKELESADFLYFARLSRVLYAYNVELDEWSYVYGRNTLWRCHMGSSWLPSGTILVTHRGRVLVASVHVNDQNTGLEGFTVFELHPHTKLPSAAATAANLAVEAADWIEVARTPRQLWEGFYEVDTSRNWNVDVNIISSGSLFCMTVFHCGGKFLYEGNYYVPLVYDLNRDSWYHLPPYKGHYDVAAVFGMRPSLVSAA